MLPNPDAELTAGFIGDVERSQINVDSLDGSSLVQEHRDLRFLAISSSQVCGYEIPVASHTKRRD